MTINFKLNGEPIEVEINEGDLLADVLREKLDLTGTKIGCGEGDCGACTVIMDGKTITSCITLAAKADGADIWTIEGIGREEKLHPIQEAYVEEGAVQCGFCIPGMILSTKTLLDKNLNPSKDDIKLALSGNICRCTGYQKIEKAVESAAEKISKNI